MQPTSNRKINNKLKPFNLFIFHFIIRMGMERHNSFFECENKRELIVSSVCCKNAAKVDVFSGVPRKKTKKKLHLRKRINRLYWSVIYWISVHEDRDQAQGSKTIVKVR